MGIPRSTVSATLGALLVVACGGKQFDSTADLDGSAPDSATAAGGGSTGAGGSSAGSGGSPNGGSPSGGTSSGGAVTSSGGRPVGTGGSGAGGSTVLRAADFEQACSLDHECTLVTEGDVCRCPGCPNAAISRDALERWEGARSTITCSGPPVHCPEPLCNETLPACAEGKCTARPALYIDAARYDTACLSDSDCKVIQPGEICSACRCGGAAVNAGAHEQYLRDIAGAKCTPGPSPCDCATIDVAHCSLSMGTFGTCTLGPPGP